VAAWMEVELHRRKVVVERHCRPAVLLVPWAPQTFVWQLGGVPSRHPFHCGQLVCLQEEEQFPQEVEEQSFEAGAISCLHKKVEPNRQELLVLPPRKEVGLVHRYFPTWQVVVPNRQPRWLWFRLLFACFVVRLLFFIIMIQQSNVDIVVVGV